MSSAKCRHFVSAPVLIKHNEAQAKSYRQHFEAYMINLSLKFVLTGPTDNTPALVQIMAWCLTIEKPLSEPKWWIH